MNDIDSPALRLHALKGNRVGFWFVTVQANWRVIFKFEDDDVYVVDYLDYH
jgi:proteic killer suppression protein